MTSFLGRLIRRKKLSAEDIIKTDLARCLSTLDLTALGIGSTLGAGAYVIAGTVAKTAAGPAVIISFLIAAVASILAGLCYAEFGARVPRAGSAYVYTYVTVGELVAFVIGWNLILEYVIGSASVARTFSGYFDDLVGDQIIPWFNATLPMHVQTLAPYVDLLALGITLLVTFILAIGVKESATFTKLFTALNLLVLCYIIICGAFKDNPDNWHLSKNEVPNAVENGCDAKTKAELSNDLNCCGRQDGCGDGGFAPFGFAGIMQGAATCFFAFVGFDAIATTGEEVLNPQKSIPISIVASLIIILVMYFGVSLTITMMVPYFALDSAAPFAKIFQNAGWNISKYIVSVGALAALCTSLLGAMFPMPRVVLAMGRDGVIFRFLSHVNHRLKTPVIATLVTGTLAGVMAAVFDVKALVDMMSIGTLLAYTLVSACVMLLRFEADSPGFQKRNTDMNLKSPLNSEKLSHHGTFEYESSDDDKLPLSPSQSLSKLITFKSLFRPGSIASPATARVVKITTAVLALFLIGLCGLLTFATSTIFYFHEIWAVVLTSIFIAAVIICVTLIGLQPQNKTKLHFTVPLVPLFPSVSMLFNIYLMMNLDALTWLRFAVWMALGFAIYFLYGIRHSSEELRDAPNPRRSSSTASFPTQYNGAVSRPSDELSVQPLTSKK